MLAPEPFVALLTPPPPDRGRRSLCHPGPPYEAGGAGDIGHSVAFSAAYSARQTAYGSVDLLASRRSTPLFDAAAPPQNAAFIFRFSSFIFRFASIMAYGSTCERSTAMPACGLPYSADAENGGG